MTVTGCCCKSLLRSYALNSIFRSGFFFFILIGLMVVPKSSAKELDLFVLLGMSKDVYIDAPEGQRMRITTIPGKTWKDCLGDPKPGEQRPCIGWPAAGPRTRMQIKDSAVAWETDPLTQEKQQKLFYKVDVEYPDANGAMIKKTGWISAQFVRADRLAKSTLHTQEVDLAVPKVSKIDPDCAVKPQTAPFQIKETGKAISYMQEELVQRLGSELGQCMGRNSNLKDVKSPFERFMRAHWNDRIQKGTEYGQYKGKPITAQQMFAIDSLARTLFGEMRGCFVNGVRYPMAVAQIVLNRAEYVQIYGAVPPFVKVPKKKDRIDFKKKSIEEIIPEVISSPLQFSPWNSDDVNLHQILCLKDLDTTHSAIWKKSLEISITSILDSDSFSKEARTVNHLHFSSGMDPWWAKGKGYRIEKPEVGGLKIDQGRCMRLWASPESDRLHTYKLRDQAFIESDEFGNLRIQGQIVRGNSE